ncbi:Ger(x)C family spore germination protein [Paenibacillus sinopodophylli]|uniref:Ger(x)C family spore germination protein n=1 Tax=Paenibacillus sinopodophylli TaxID=1837342 RepID=UPI00110CAF0E|nr:Ger(x)C family spore germination protein [Paenibacillus sinopodophylli]
MKQQSHPFASLIVIMGCLILSACGDQLSLENASTPLALGIDLDQDEKFHFYATAPVYSKNIKKKSQEITGEAESLRQSKALQDSQTAGSVQGRNYQVLLIGRHLLQYNDWFPMLDVIFRDARNTITDRIIVVDGSVKELLYLNPPDQPLLPIILRGMVDTKTTKSETYSTTAQELHRQFMDKGVTPYVAEVKVVNKQIQLKGSALLNERGKYMMSLNAQETILLNILQKQADPGFSLSYLIPDKPQTGPFATNMLSFTGGKVKTSIKTAYANQKFKFDIHIKTTVGLSEHIFPIDITKDSPKLQKQISSLMQEQIEGIIEKLKKHKIDPIGLGVYARAYQYEHFKQVEDEWGEAISRSEINVKVDLTIGAMGPVK